MSEFDGTYDLTISKAENRNSDNDFDSVKSHLVTDLGIADT